MTRIRRLAGLLWVLATTSACIWPQPVNEEPTPPPPSDVAPTIKSSDPTSGPLPAATNQGHCQITVRKVVANSPIGRRLSIRFYLNYLNGLLVPDAPINKPDPLPMQGPTDGDQELGELQTITLNDFQSRLKGNGPNTLWVWVSDGFKTTNCPTWPATCDPSANNGFYSTSFSWTIDFSQCPNFPAP